MHPTANHGRKRKMPAITSHSASSSRKINRLGNDELGPHAYEKSMPEWQRKRITNQQGVQTTLRYGSEPTITVPILANETTSIIPILRELSGKDDNVESFAYCHPATNHIGNRYREGGFCGYRSIAMILSYLRGCSTAPKRLQYASRLPDILDLQDIIENAWSHGYNSHARLETGGIRGTRKFIGTSEAEACLRFLRIPCSVVAIGPGPRKPTPCDALLEVVEKYFHSPTTNPEGKAPIFFQRKGHSTVIVGYEKWKKRSVKYPKIGWVESPFLRNLIVFDCAVSVAETLKLLRGGSSENLGKHLPLLTKYRVDRHDLERYDRFELVFLDEAVVDGNKALGG